MNMQELKSLIYQGEKVDVECKKAQGKVPDSVYETYSSFANTKGGTIVLGVLEDKTKVIPEERFIIQGVDNHEKLREDFWNTINSQKVNANLLVDDNVYAVEEDGIALLGNRGVQELILRFVRYIKAKILLREPTREIMRVTIMRRSTKCVL